MDWSLQLCIFSTFIIEFRGPVGGNLFIFLCSDAYSDDTTGQHGHQSGDNQEYYKHPVFLFNSAETSRFTFLTLLANFAFIILLKVN